MSHNFNVANKGIATGVGLAGAIAFVTVAVIGLILAVRVLRR